MKLRDFSLFTDQNLHADVVAFLRSEGFDVCDVNESGWAGETDTILFHRAANMGRAVVTHDSDFGRMAFQQADPFVGIVYLRPGHLLPVTTVDSLRQLLDSDPDVQPSFVIVVKRRNGGVKVRVAHMPP